jgi:hypothetical protein
VPQFSTSKKRSTFILYVLQFNALSEINKFVNHLQQKF